MSWRPFLFAIFLLAPCSAAPAADDPVAAIRAIYDAYVVAEKTGKDAPDFLTQSFYSVRIKGRIAEMRKSCVEGSQCGPDYDFLIDGQDYQLRNLRIVQRSRDAGKAVVEAKFSNLGAASDKVFMMIREGESWKIDEIENASGGTPGNLTNLLNEAAKSQRQ
jgi:hypothetical protein